MKMLRAAQGAIAMSSLWVYAASCVSLFALFVPFLSSDFILDDGHKIVENRDLRDVDRLPWSLFPRYPQGERDLSLQFKMNRNDPSRPLTFLMFTLEYWIAGGAHPWIFRFVNVVLHAINGALLHSLLNLLYDRLSVRGSNRVDFKVRHAAATLLWMFSPINISTVNYIYSRSEILGFTIELFCFHIVLRHRKRSIATFASTFLALCAKQSYLCIVPCIIVLFALFPSLVAHRHSSNQVHRQSLYHVIVAAFQQALPCIFAAFIYMLYRFCHLGGLGDLEADPSNQPIPWLNYISTQPFAIFSYIRIVFCGGMAVDHGVLSSDPLPILSPSLALSVFFAITCAISRGSPVSFKAALFGWAVALLHLAPTSLLVTTDVMADRRFYVASIPLILFTCSAISTLYVKLSANFMQHFSKSNFTPSLTIAALLGVIFIVQICTSYRHLSAYVDNISAWRNVLSLYPASVRAHNNLATALIKQSRSCPPGIEFSLQSDCAAPLVGEAFFHFEWLIKRDPSDYIALSNIGDLLCSPTLSHKNSIQNCSEAEIVLHQAVYANSRFSSSAYNLALFYQRMNFLNDAEHWYLHAISHNPHHVLSYNNLGVLYMNIGRQSLALHYFKRGLSVDPNNELIHSNIPAVRNARVLFTSEIERVYAEPSVCNVALLCLSNERASSWGKILTLPSALRKKTTRPTSMSTGSSTAHSVSQDSENFRLISAKDDSEIPEHATPVQLRPEEYIQLLERALKEQPNNLQFRKLAIETCDSMGNAECGMRHRNWLEKVQSSASTMQKGKEKQNKKSLL